MELPSRYLERWAHRKWNGDRNSLPFIALLTSTRLGISCRKKTY